MRMGQLVKSKKAPSNQQKGLADMRTGHRGFVRPFALDGRQPTILRGVDGKKSS
jgi:hypothetical protein